MCTPFGETESPPLEPPVTEVPPEAAALLPPGGGSTEIANEVQRLWQLNKSRIGTGDPNLLLVGAKLLIPQSNPAE